MSVVVVENNNANEIDEAENSLLKELVRYQRNWIDMEFSDSGRSGVNYAIRSIEARKWVEDYYNWEMKHLLSFPFPSRQGIDRLSREQLEEYRAFNEKVIYYFWTSANSKISMICMGMLSGIWF